MNDYREGKSKQIMKTLEKERQMVQMPLRCSAELQERIIKALGASMNHSGKKVSKNEFLIRLVEIGLDRLEVAH